MITNWNGKPYHSLDYMLKERFGEKVYKVTLNGGMSCPNRDGPLQFPDTDRDSAARSPL